MKTIRKNAFYKLMLNFFNVAVPMLMVPYIFRVLGPERVGEIEYTQSIFGYFFILASLGLYSYGIREVSSVRDDPKRSAKLLSELFTISAIANIVGFTLFIVFISFNKGNDRIIALMYILSFNFFSNIFLIEWVNESLENYGFITVKTVIIRLIFLGAIFLLVRSTDDFLVFVAINSAYALLNNLASFFYIRRNLSFSFKNLSLKKHIKPLLYITVMTNGWVLYSQIDKTFLGTFSSMKEVAFYSSAGKVVDILFPLLMSATAVSTPRLAYYLEHSRSRYTALVQRISGFSVFIIIPAATGIFLLSDEIMRILGADKFAAAGPVLTIFAVYMIVLMIERMYTHNVLFVFRREKALNVLIIGFGLLNLLSKILLIPILTARVAILSTLVFHAGLAFAQHLIASKRLSVSTGIFSFRHIRYILVAIFFIPIAIFVKKYFSNEFFVSAIVASLCSGIYFTVFVLVKDEHALAVKKLIEDVIRRVFRMAGFIQ
jgi:O-antigen/teichoic acid export membrane protein